ncbi:hypothetical protein N0V83_003119 [Neocucurbitaria cava]|uniref:CBM-cenC domain-containing protein n=1 Tax=Neocucurbitaria cava TaxID=798079 RepID=A0A9W8YF05_9PLEO|nr:hypothetical protein N0V83_003119 [Neocucurbitaria cava]
MVLSSKTSSSTTSRPASSTTATTCFATPTGNNYITNPGFEQGSSSWSTSTSGWGTWSASGTGLFTTDNAHSGTSAYRGTTDSIWLTTYTLYQTVTVPCGAKVSVSAWARSLAPKYSGLAAFTLTFDGWVVDAALSTSKESGAWFQLSGSTMTSSGSTSRVLRLDVTTVGYKGAVFAADDFKVAVVAGPGGQQVCSS